MPGSSARLLVALYCVLYVLLSLEAFSLLIGSLLLFCGVGRRDVRHSAHRLGQEQGRLRGGVTIPNFAARRRGMTSHTLPPKRIFPTSEVDARAAEHVPPAPQTESVAYKLAFQDTEFLLREDLRPVRFQLELLKPELLLNEANIGSTFVFYGSARIPSPEMADALVAAATNPEQEKIAERLKAKARYYDVARELAKLASDCGCDEEGKKHFVVCSGGGPSIMEAANRGAAEAGQGIDRAQHRAPARADAQSLRHVRI